jgi:hypothetical protein
MVAKELKEKYPIYPVVRRETTKGKRIVFKTLVRKRFNGVYYLIPMVQEDTNEAKCIHALHASVYKELMLGKSKISDVRDDDQTNECQRLNN